MSKAVTGWGWYALALLLAWGVVPRAAFAVDAITLTSGLIIEGDVTVENERLVKIRVRGRVMQFPRASIASIEYGPDSTAPSQIQKREDDSKENLKEAQKKVKAFKIKRKAKKKKKKKKETDGPVQTVLAPDGTLNIPSQATDEEKKWIEELRKGKDKIGACRALAGLKSTYALPTLIRALDYDSPYVRNEANKALRSITAQHFGFQGDERKRSIRTEAIKRWQRWYEKASGKKVPWG